MGRWRGVQARQILSHALLMRVMPTAFAKRRCISCVKYESIINQSQAMRRARPQTAQRECRCRANPISKTHSERTTMTAQKGKDLLIKIADGAGYTTVAGLRTRRLAFNAETVDITHAESTNRWRELLDGAGVKRAAVSGRGLFKDAATDALMRQTFFEGGIAGYQIVIPSFGTVQGPFQIASLEFSGEHNGEVTYDMALESAGELTFVADT